MVVAIGFNSSGTRLALGSIDHKIRVFDQDENKTWNMIDAWTGHDAEVLDVSAHFPRYTALLNRFYYRSSGLALRLVKYSEPSGATTSSSYGKKTRLKQPCMVVVSNAYSRNPPAAQSDTYHLILRL